MRIKTISLLFARWVVTHYGSEYLNQINGDAWNELYNHFKSIVLPNYKSNGSYNNAKIFYSKPNIPVRLKVVEKIVEIPEKIVYVPYQSNGCNCGQMSCIICHG
jgi:hypothetical protein